MLYMIKKAVDVNERVLISRLEIQKRFAVKAKRLENYGIYPKFVKLVSRKYAIEYFLLKDILKIMKKIKSTTKGNENEK